MLRSSSISLPTTLAGVALVLSSCFSPWTGLLNGVMGATPPCGMEPQGGFPFDKICNDHCSSSTTMIGPGTLPESSQYRIAAFYFGFQS
mmetsp:Transcript_27197/g.38256  ORF Transcript_27197/g.38256 Transcript_27197/m.38256 type:complete len:89 (-) Transcript_27197:862-1128(-)